ncbi:peroxiredoxin [Mycetocola spongiae]|uniref:peroxiredoxin n=1 Tax=Mycetocola spongiae TaxID=2859226 RepID=UPI001CF18783|nr:peroxiredoxin [Mycetocola spongiae]UCR89480.1 peroxiredoxin [Mycetocola spongiae]
MLNITEQAPDFTLLNQFGESVTLSEFAGRKAVALVFIPLAFSGICTGELCELRDNLTELTSADVELLVVSVDSKWALRIWGEREGYDFTLLADFWPHGAVAQKYGVYDEGRGVAQRATFLIDIHGVIRDAFMTEPGQPRAIARYRDAVAALAAPGLS